MVWFWATVLGITVLLYVLLDGFDLGVGLLFPLAADEPGRRHMMDAISPMWDGNETWLVMSGGALFGAFPLAYAILLGAFYIPLIVMLCGLILRGVAFEFRGRTDPRLRWIWSASFFVGSFVATFAQGAAIGAFVQVLPVHDGLYTGSIFSWLSPFSILCGFGLCFGYAMLGASWLIHKTDADVRDFGYRMLPKILVALGVFVVLAFIFAFVGGYRITHLWVQRPELFLFPVIALIAAAAMYSAIMRRRDSMPYLMALTMFICAYATIVLAVMPYIVPFSITIAQAAAPPASLTFLFWGAGLIVFPITLIYTAVIYWVFRGKVVPT